MKRKDRLLAEPLRFVAGEPTLPARFTPAIDANVLAVHEIVSERFAVELAQGAYRASKRKPRQRESGAREVNGKEVVP